MSDDDFDPAPPPPAPAPTRRTDLPDMESYLFGCFLIEGSDTLERAIAAGLTARDFVSPALGELYSACCKLREEGTPLGIDTLADHLGPTRLSRHGGIAGLMALDHQTTTARAEHALRTIIGAADLRHLERVGAAVQERAKRGEDPQEIIAYIERAKAPRETVVRSARRSPFSFTIPARDDPSILLGNRYLNRGDGIVLSSSSGMGKSSMAQQMAGDWALGRPFHGITSNGPLRILIVQSEDSDGDIAEVWQSLAHVNKWTPEERRQIEQNVRIVCEKSLRGAAFIRFLSAEIRDFTPDLVVINPLQAYMDGDVTDSRDLGAFLREGLNGINRDSRFGYLIVHHTTKPATGKDRAERQWHEVMYDMAGGAEIINWARGIISLRALEDEGKFKVVLAKRGRRAGVVRPVEAGAGVRLEPVTVFGLQHAKGHLPNGTPIIFWEAAEIPADAEEKSERAGRPSKFQFSDYRSLFPPKSSPGLTINELHRALLPNGEIKRNSLHQICVRWAEENEVEIINVDGQPRRYRRLV